MTSSLPIPAAMVLRPDPFGMGGSHASVVLASLAFDPEVAGDVSAVTEALHRDEQALAAAMPAPRRAAFAAGRYALRAAVHAVSPVDATAPLLHTGRGAPHLPDGIAGSISHKRRRAIAVASADRDLHLGVDLEERPTPDSLARPSIAKRILTAREYDELSSLDPLAHREATLLRFALKEAVYKAIDPTVHRYVRFTEVEVDVHADGRASVTLLLPEIDTQPLHVESHWMLDEHYIVAMASCRATPPAR